MRREEWEGKECVINVRSRDGRRREVVDYFEQPMSFGVGQPPETRRCGPEKVGEGKECV